MNGTISKQRGFTLIEVIVTIVIAAMVGMVVFTYLGNVLARSTEPIAMVQDLAEAVDVMEGFAATYHDYLTGSIGWGDFTATLSGTGVNVSDQTNTYNLIFQVREVSVTRNNHTVSALFTQ